MTPRIRQSPAVQKLVQRVRDTSRQLQGLEREMEKKTAEIARMRLLGQEKYVIRENDLMNMSMLVMQLTDEGNGGVIAEDIFQDSDDPIIVRRRRTMNEMISSLRFLYAYDIMEELTPEMRVIVNEATQDWEAFTEQQRRPA